MNTLRAARESYLGSFIVEFLAPLILGISVPILLGALVILVMSNAVRWAPTVPKCPEDAVLIGGGNFKDGYWDYLYCWQDR